MPIATAASLGMLQPTSGHSYALRSRPLSATSGSPAATSAAPIEQRLPTRTGGAPARRDMPPAGLLPAAVSQATRRPKAEVAARHLPRAQVLSALGIYAGASVPWLVAGSTAHLCRPGAATWLQQAAFVLPTLAGAFLLTKPGLCGDQMLAAQLCVGAFAGSLAAAAVGMPGYRAPAVGCASSLIALALALQTGKRLWRAGNKPWPKEWLPWSLRATLPVQLWATTTYLAGRTAAAAATAAAPAPWALSGPTTVAPSTSAACQAIAALTMVAMFATVKAGRLDRFHARQPFAAPAFALVGLMVGVAGLQAYLGRVD